VNPEELECVACGHSFRSTVPVDQAECPRCWSTRLKSNPWLLLTDAADLSEEDYVERVAVAM